MRYPHFVSTPAAVSQQQGPRKRGRKIGKKLKMIEAEYCGLPADQGGEETFLALARCAGVNPEKAKEQYQLMLRLAKRGK